MTRPAPQLHAGPLGWSDYAEIARAARLLRPVRRAERVAATGGWFMLLTGALMIPFALGSGVRLALAIALVVLGLREITLCRTLRQLEPSTLKRLAWNQIGLATSFTAFALVNLLQAPPPSILDSQLSSATPELASLGSTIGRFAHYGGYVIMIAGAWTLQGAQAAFYARTARRLRKTYAASPMWVMRVHAAAWGGQAPDPSTAFAADAPHRADRHPDQGGAEPPLAAA